MFSVISFALTVRLGIIAWEGDIVQWSSPSVTNQFVMCSTHLHVASLVNRLGKMSVVNNSWIRSLVTT